MSVAVDCDLGRTLSHGGGYPGYGSYVLLLPDRGMGIFAMANRTYAGPSVAVWDAAVALNKAGLLGKDRDLPASEDVLAAYKTVGALYAAGDVTGGREHFAMNFLLDRDAQGWSRKLATLKAQVGECDTTSSAMATGALSADFTWRCAHGRVEGSLSLAPTHPPRIQQWLIEAVAP